jgi:hypothetical protein
MCLDIPHTFIKIHDIYELPTDINNIGVILEAQ